MTILRRFFQLLAFSMWSSNLYAQKSITATGEYSMRVENNMTLNEAKSFAIQLAQLNAIEMQFGKVIAQDNSTYVSNSQSGDNVVTNTVFNFLSNSYVKGEWVEDIKDPAIKEFYKDDEHWIDVTVEGKIREVQTISIKFEAYSTSCPELKCKTISFNDGQDFYYVFKSPEDGYLSLYLTDPEYSYTFLLLPYKKSVHKKCVPIKGDKEYVFFSKNHDYFNDGPAIDEQTISLAPKNLLQKYQLWCIFSREPLEKPLLEDESVTTKKFLDQESLKQGYSLPKGISEDKFRLWIQEYRVHNKKIQLQQLNITVKK